MMITSKYHFLLDTLKYQNLKLDLFEISLFFSCSIYVHSQEKNQLTKRKSNVFIRQQSSTNHKVPHKHTHKHAHEHTHITYYVTLFSATMGSIYEAHKDEDGFLYVAYSGENTFGSE